MKRSEKIKLLKRTAAYLAVIPFLVVPYNRHLQVNDDKKTIPYGRLEFVTNQDDLLASENEFNQILRTVPAGFVLSGDEGTKETMIGIERRTEVIDAQLYIYNDMLGKYVDNSEMENKLRDKVLNRKL